MIQNLDVFHVPQSCSSLPPSLASKRSGETGKETQGRKRQVCDSQTGGGKNVGEGRWWILWAVKDLPSGDVVQVS